MSSVHRRIQPQYTPTFANDGDRHPTRTVLLLPPLDQSSSHLFPNSPTIALLDAPVPTRFFDRPLCLLRQALNIPRPKLPPHMPFGAQPFRRLMDPPGIVLQVPFVL